MAVIAGRDGIAVTGGIATATGAGTTTDGGGGASGAEVWLQGLPRDRGFEPGKSFALERREAEMDLGKLDRLIDPPRPRGKGGFEFLRAVGGKHKQQRGILAQAVHFVEQLVEQAFLARAVHGGAGAGDQVHILENHHGRL